MNSGGERGSVAADRVALTSEPWLDKRDLAAHLACSVRSVERALAEGMPSAVVFGRRKFRVSEVEPWLEAHGYLVRHGWDAPVTVVAGSTEWAGGADTPRPRTPKE